MIRFKRGNKKLQLAAELLKRCTNSVQSKLQKFDVRRTIGVIKSNTSRFIAYCSNHLFVPFHRRFLTKPSHSRYQHRHHYYSRENRLGNSSPIYIDKLYQPEQAGSSGTGKTEKERIMCSIEDAWREAVAKSPQLRSVDERAEEFIYKFRQDMKIQKEKSNLEYQEMLARSA